MTENTGEDLSPEDNSDDEMLTSEQPEEHRSATVEPDSSTEQSSTTAADDVSPESSTGKSLKRPKRGTRTLIEWVAVLLAALLIALGLRTFAFQVFFVPSTSMVPALLVGDRILVDKAFFSYHSLKRGDIVVFSRPPADTMCGSDESDLVKRVIGLPGQTVSESPTGQVMINGKAIKEPYLPANDPLGAEPIRTQKIAPNHFFVLGDNREISCDSRYWGTIAGSSIVGKVVAVIWRSNHPWLHTF